MASTNDSYLVGTSLTLENTPLNSEETLVHISDESSLLTENRVDSSAHYFDEVRAKALQGAELLRINAGLESVSDSRDINARDGRFRHKTAPPLLAGNFGRESSDASSLFNIETLTSPPFGGPAFVPERYETPQDLQDALNLELQVLNLQSPSLDSGGITSLDSLAATPHSAQTHTLTADLNAKLARWLTQGLSHSSLGSITDWSQLLDKDSHQLAVINDYAAPRDRQELQAYLEVHVLRPQPQLAAEDATTLATFAALEPTPFLRDTSSRLNDELSAVKRRWGKTLPAALFSVNHWADLLQADSHGRNSAVTAGYVSASSQADVLAVLNASVTTSSAGEVNSLDQLLGQPIDSRRHRGLWTDLQQELNVLQQQGRLVGDAASARVIDILTPAQSQQAMLNGYRPAETRDELNILLNARLPEIYQKADQSHLPRDIGELTRDYRSGRATEVVEEDLQKAFTTLKSNQGLGKLLQNEVHWSAALGADEYTTAIAHGYVPLVSSSVAALNRAQSDFEVAGQLNQLVQEPLLKSLTQVEIHQPGARRDAYQTLIGLSGEMQRQGQQAAIPGVSLDQALADPRLLSAGQWQQAQPQIKAYQTTAQTLLNASADYYQVPRDTVQALADKAAADRLDQRRNHTPSDLLPFVLNMSQDVLISLATGFGTGAGSSFGTAMLPAAGTLVGATGGGVLGGLLAVAGSRALAPAVLDVLGREEGVDQVFGTLHEDVTQVVSSLTSLGADQVANALGGGQVMKEITSLVASLSVELAPKIQDTYLPMLQAGRPLIEVMALVGEEVVIQAAQELAVDKGMEFGAGAVKTVGGTALVEIADILNIDLNQWRQSLGVASSTAPAITSSAPTSPVQNSFDFGARGKLEISGRGEPASLRRQPGDRENTPSPGVTQDGFDLGKGSNVGATTAPSVSENDSTVGRVVEEKGGIAGDNTGNGLDDEGQTPPDDANSPAINNVPTSEGVREALAEILGNPDDPFIDVLLPQVLADYEAGTPISEALDNIRQIVPSLTGLDQPLPEVRGLATEGTVNELDEYGDLPDEVGQQPMPGREQAAYEFEPSDSESLRGQNLVMGYLREKNFDGVDINGSDMTEITIAHSSFNGANLSNSTMTGAALRDSNFVGANLSGVNLSGSSIISVNLADANLSNADLSNAVINVNLENADLSGADLRGSEFFITKDLWSQLGNTEGIKINRKVLENLRQGKEAHEGINFLRFDDSVRRSIPERLPAIDTGGFYVIAAYQSNDFSSVTDATSSAVFLLAPTSDTRDLNGARPFGAGPEGSGAHLEIATDVIMMRLPPDRRLGMTLRLNSDGQSYTLVTQSDSVNRDFSMPIHGEIVRGEITESTRPDVRNSNAYVPREFVESIKNRLESELNINITHIEDNPFW